MGVYGASTAFLGYTFEESPLWESIVETMVQLEGEINSINES